MRKNVAISWLVFIAFGTSFALTVDRWAELLVGAGMAISAAACIFVIVWNVYNEHPKNAKKDQN